MRAFGLASRRVSGVICPIPCRFQTGLRSLVPSGVKGRSMGSIDPNKWVISQVKMVKAGPHTRFLEKPVDLALMNPVVLRTVEESQPVQYASRV